VQFREATPRDRAEILALRARVFGDVDPEKLDPRFLEWEFSNARVFVGEQDGAILTHVAMVPWGPVVLAVDAMTAPEARGSGAYSKVFGVATDAVRDHVLHAYQIRKAVLGPVLRNGWTVAESIPVLVRPASLRALAGWKPAERPAGSRRSLRREDAEEMAALGRTREFIEWRFFDNPLWMYSVSGARDSEGRLVGWLVARRTMLKGLDTFAIVDVAFSDKRAAAELIRDAVGEAKRIGCKLAAAFVSRAHPARPLLLRRFFVPGPHRFRLLTYAAPQTAWRVTWADTDHL
jgi:hypothetical protein